MKEKEIKKAMEIAERQFEEEDIKKKDIKKKDGGKILWNRVLIALIFLISLIF